MCSQPQSKLSQAPKTMYKIIILSSKRIFVIVCLLLFTASLLYINLEKSDYQFNKKSKKLSEKRNEKNTVKMENFLDCEGEIVRDSNIFLVDTTRMRKPTKEREMTLRQSCSVESSAIANADINIYLLIVSPFRAVDEITTSPALKAILTYPNIHVKSLNLNEFAEKFSYGNFTKHGDIMESIFIKQHTSDFLRLLLLKTFGGTYIDMDMIVTKSFQDLPDNSICHDHGFLNGAFLKLDTSDVGRNLANIFLNDMIENYHPNEWGWNGPLMIERVLKKLCNVVDINKLDICEGLSLLDQNICYPVGGLEWEKNFKEETSDVVFDQIRGSYMIHFWNKLSKEIKLDCNSKSAYTLLAKKYCPKSFELCKKYF